jgi:hypothetical protein
VRSRMRILKVQIDGSELAIPEVMGDLRGAYFNYDIKISIETS